MSWEELDQVLVRFVQDWCRECGPDLSETDRRYLTRTLRSRIHQAMHDEMRTICQMQCPVVPQSAAAKTGTHGV